jgi:hypothetical protein
MSRVSEVSRVSRASRLGNRSSDSMKFMMNLSPARMPACSCTRGGPRKVFEHSTRLDSTTQSDHSTTRGVSLGLGAPKTRRGEGRGAEGGGQNAARRRKGKLRMAEAALDDATTRRRHDARTPRGSKAATLLLVFEGGGQGG